MLFFFCKQDYFLSFLFLLHREEDYKKSIEGYFREYILTRFRKSQKENHSDPKKYQGLILLVFLIFVSKISQILCIFY